MPYCSCLDSLNVFDNLPRLPQPLSMLPFMSVLRPREQLLHVTLIAHLDECPGGLDGVSLVCCCGCGFECHE